MFMAIELIADSAGALVTNDPGKSLLTSQKPAGGTGPSSKAPQRADQPPGRAGR